MPSCETLGAVFLGIMACVLLGQVTAIVAWRQRLPHLERWRWMVDPLCVFRTSHYQQPAPTLRYWAAGFQIAGTLAAVWLAVQLIAAQKSGMAKICGFSF